MNLARKLIRRASQLKWGFRACWSSVCCFVGPPISVREASIVSYGVLDGYRGLMSGTMEGCTKSDTAGKLMHVVQNGSTVVLHPKGGSS